MFVQVLSGGLCAFVFAFWRATAAHALFVLGLRGLGFRAGLWEAYGVQGNSMESGGGFKPSVDTALMLRDLHYLVWRGLRGVVHPDVGPAYGTRGRTSFRQS